MGLHIVNVVGGGSLNREIDLSKLSEDIVIGGVEYDPDNFPGVLIKLESNGTTLMLFSSGKYSLAGADSYESAYEANKIFISEMKRLLENYQAEINFELRYMVCTGQLDSSINLNDALVKLGIEETEYEPEQFPGLFYRPKNVDWFAILFSSGKLVLNGRPDIEYLEGAYDHLEKKLNS